jgi:hypothetical protein
LPYWRYLTTKSNGTDGEPRDQSLTTSQAALNELADLKFTLDQLATPVQIPSQSLHSLRNKLAVIIGHCDVLKEHLKVDSQSTELLDAIKAVAYSIAKNYAS